MTLGSNLDTLDLLRSSANVLNPGEGESSTGLGKGSVIPNFHQEPHGWALSDEDSLSAGLAVMLSGRVLLVVSVVILCQPCLWMAQNKGRSPSQFGAATRGHQEVFLHLLLRWTCGTLRGA